MILLESDQHPQHWQLLKSLGKHLTFARLIIIFLLGFVLSAVLGSDFIKSKELDPATVFRNAYSIPANYLKGLLAKPELIIIDIKHKEFQKLAYKRKTALEEGMLFTGSDDMVPAKIRYADQTLKAKLRLKGDLLDHLNEERKWSFRIKLSGDNTLFGMKQFSIQHPKTRGYLSEWFALQIARMENVIALRFQFVNVILNGKDLGIYALEEHFDKRLIEHNGRLNGPIIKYDESHWWTERMRFIQSRSSEYEEAVETLSGLGDYYSLPINVFQGGKIVKDKVLKNHFLMGQELLDRFRQGQLKASQVFDIEKMAFYFALNDLYGDNHALHPNQYRFYYNPVNSLLEPIPFDMGEIHPIIELSGLYSRDSRFIGNGKHLFIQQLFSDPTMWEAYIAYLEKMSATVWLDDVFNALDKPMQKALGEIYAEFPYYHFQRELLHNNQDYIRNFINPAAGILAYQSDKPEFPRQLDIGNIQALPIEILGINYQDALFKVEGNDRMILPGKTQAQFADFRRVSFSIPDGLHPEPEKTSVIYRILGAAQNKSAGIYNWPRNHEEFNASAFLRDSSDLSTFPFLEVNEASKQIQFKPGKWTLNKVLSIPAGYRVIAGRSVELDLIDSALLVSRSPINFTGSENAPVIIKSSDASGQGMILLSAKERSIIHYTQFDNLAHPTQGGWGASGSVTFYESPVIISHSVFSNNHSEDAINFKTSNYELLNSVLKNTLSDALDADFSYGMIQNCIFENSGNDAIDTSGSHTKIENVLIDKAGDKGLSAGEASSMSATNVKILNSAIAVTSKDESTLDISNLTLENNAVGFAVFKKKPEFGSSSVTVNGISDNQKTKVYLVEKGSSLLIDGIAIPSNNDKVKKLLYGAEYGKATVR